MAMTPASIVMAATRTLVLIITIITLITIIVILISAPLAAPKLLDGIRQLFDLFLEWIIDFFVMVDASTCTFKSKFSEIVHFCCCQLQDAIESSASEIKFKVGLKGRKERKTTPLRPSFTNGSTMIT